VDANMKNKYEIRGDITAIFLKYKGNIFETIINTSDFDEINSNKGTWFPCWSNDSKSFYANGRYMDNGKRITIGMHRFLLKPDKNLKVDHRDHDTLNNTRENLKAKTTSENAQNRKGAQTNSRSGIRGVVWDKANNRWNAVVRLNNKDVFCRYFRNIIDAEKAVIEARKKYFISV
jgi:hypothetical protein